MWDFFETVRHRHSIRKYQAETPVETEKLNAILEMACAAPSAGDLQAYHITVVHSEQVRKQLAGAAPRQQFLAEAPVLLVFSAEPVRSAELFGERGANIYALQDTTIAATYAQLAVVAAGMASTWVGDFDEQQVREILGLEADQIPLSILSIGYPAEVAELSPRRHLDELVTWR
ncbi:MAG TPA: nitroreductase [Gammaproteobacteria bacterium]|nr:nitroreductase [Gammaproteobacteria bacterium]